MDKRLIAFKGDQDGIHIHIKKGEFETIKMQLDSKLEKAKDFFKGGKVISFKGRKLTQKEENILKDIINKKHGIAVESKNTNEMNSNKYNFRSNSFFNGINEGETKFIQTTVRSGQKLEYSGNLVVLGDVNPGAEVIAWGNIVILGALRGIAHAGSNGNRDAFVVAFSLLSYQIRIADVIARSPDGEKHMPLGPEIARIKNGKLFIQSC